MKTKRFAKFTPVEIQGTHCSLQLAEISIVDCRGTTTHPAACISIAADDEENELAEWFDVKELNTLISYLQRLLHQIQREGE